MFILCVHFVCFILQHKFLFSQFLYIFNSKALHNPTLSSRPCGEKPCQCERLKCNILQLEMLTWCIVNFGGHITHTVADGILCTLASCASRCSLSVSRTCSHNYLLTTNLCIFTLTLHSLTLCPLTRHSIHIHVLGGWSYSGAWSPSSLMTPSSTATCIV